MTPKLDRAIAASAALDGYPLRLRGALSEKTLRDVHV